MTAPLPEGGGGWTPTYMAQNDPHVVLIILATQMWAKIFWLKKLFQAKICVPAPLVATSVLTQNKGPGTEAHFWTPPPPSPGAHAIPPTQSNFRVAKLLFHPPCGMCSRHRLTHTQHSAYLP